MTLIATGTGTETAMDKLLISSNHLLTVMHLSFDLNGFYSKLEADNYNRNYMLFLINQVNNHVPPSSSTVTDGTVVAASWPAGTTNACCQPSSRTAVSGRPFRVALQPALKFSWISR